MSVVSTMNQGTKTIVPDTSSSAGKKQQVEQMFDDIAGKYDLLNRVLSMRIDTAWRNRVVHLLRKEKPRRILDVATGTADLAIALSRTGAKKIVGIDLSENMLSIGRKKIAKKNLSHIISLQKGDSEHLVFPNDTFDAVTVSFGVRNFEHLDKGLAEMCRVMKPGGTLAILEFSQPRIFPFRQLYQFYFHNVLPVVGQLVSRNVTAYTYLPESVAAFPYGQKLADILEQAGFREIKWKVLSFGICTLYSAKK